MGRFTKILRDKGIKKLSSDEKVHNRVRDRSKKIVEDSKRKLLRDFMSHPVTKEIKGGPDASSLSGAISGPGNLYSFIGFQNGADPVGEVYNLLDSLIYLSAQKPKVVRKTKTRVYLGIKVNVPNDQQLAMASKMPWEPGSWLFKIERGMSGLGYYIYEKYIRASRSGTGIQADGKVRTGLFKRTTYMSAILKTFRGNFTK